MYIYDEKNNEWISVRHTSQYKKKKRIVRDAWIVSGTFMVLLPPSAVMVFALWMTFMSFTLLDESVYTLPTQ